MTDRDPKRSGVDAWLGIPSRNFLGTDRSKLPARFDPAHKWPPEPIANLALNALVDVGCVAFRVVAINRTTSPPLVTIQQVIREHDGKPCKCASCVAERTKGRP